MFLFVSLATLGLLVVQSDPGLTPAAAQIVVLVAAALPVLNRYIVEILRSAFPSIGDAAGEIVSRNVGIVLFVVFAALGMAAAPDVIMPTVPTSADGFDWLAFGGQLVLTVGSLLTYVVNGSRWVHERIKG
jgi:hypothetical protein